MKRLSISAVRSWSVSGNLTCPDVLDLLCPFCGRSITATARTNTQRDVSIGLSAVCPSCHQTIKLWVPNPEAPQEEIVIFVYPDALMERDPIAGSDLIPEGIRRAYFHTISSYRSSSWVATTLLCRRTLEGMVSDVLGKKGLSLAKGLSELSQKEDLIAKILHPMQVLRRAGNFGAHFDESEPDQELATAMLAFLEFVLDTVYILPHRADSVSNKIEALQSSSD